ncbi:MAG: hypothetical protein OXI03_08435, partial [Chloroflexota bacterium]|nr:hypothetical protein [Chloroflexota bacterium]
MPIAARFAPPARRRIRPLALAVLAAAGLTPGGLALDAAQLAPSDPRYGEQAPTWNLLGAP